MMKGEDVHVSEEEWFFEQVSQHKRNLYGIAFSYLRNEADALEVLQEATCRAWSKRKSLKDPERLTPWMIRILINCCMDELKRRKRKITAEPQRYEDGVMELASDRRLDMEKALDNVKPKYRQVLVLKYYRDMTLTQIAEVLEKPEGTIKTWLNKGLKQLRDKLKGKGDLYHG
ncbi:RNA polymerase sigma factor [Paenibacillus wynnii]|uniref:RNA polymerase sigma factor n=1 Tax=Paenibacillus wynnii TaxID=268407 RepID=A0A098M2Q0_9BACL|nr:RNA polymerase sigma factor [Paenibacillus wynnii]